MAISREARVAILNETGPAGIARRRLRVACASGFAIVLAVSAANAQQAPSPGGAQQATTADRGRPLEGRWKVELVLDPFSMTNPPPAERVDGELAFGSTSWWTNTDRFGRHSLDTRPFFGRLYAAPQNVAAFGPADTSMFTEITGGVIGDSVGIDFLPRIDHGGLSLWGRFYGDSARGIWHRRGAEGSGRFVMRRVASGPVAVAAIPLPSAAPAVALASNETTAKDAKGAKGRAKKGTKSETKAESKVATAAAAKAPAKSGATTVAAATAPPQVSAPPAAAQSSNSTSKSPVTTPSVTAQTQVASARPATPAPVGTRPVTGGASTAAAPPTQAASFSPAPTTSSPKPAASSTSPAPATTSSKPAAASAAPAAASATAAVSTTSTASPSSTAAKPPAPNAMRVSRTAPPDPSATGALRVRMFDRASKKYFSTRYQLHLPDGSFRWGNFRSGSGDDGFGPVVPSRPGRYEIEVENFVCGDKYWFFANKVVRPVVVKAGETTDVTIDLDLTSEPARKTIDNKTGALCAAPPGDAK